MITFTDMEEVSNENAMSIHLKKKLSFVRMKNFSIMGISKTYQTSFYTAKY